MGDQTELSFGDNSGQTHFVTLTAYDDSMITIYNVYPFTVVSDRLREMLVGVESDSRGGVGGVAPTIRIPMTREHALMVAQGEDVELAEALAILRNE